MNDIKNTILKTNTTGKMTTTTTKFAKLLKINEACVFDILTNLKSNEFLEYQVNDDQLIICIVNKENFKFKCQKVVKENTIICLYCGNKVNTRFSSNVINGVKHKTATCYCAKYNTAISERLECKFFRKR